MPTHLIRIRGMTCEHCAQSLSNALRAAPGVRQAQVDLHSQTARVDHDDRTGGIGDLMAAVQRAGFQVEGFQTENPSVSDPTR